MRRRQPVRGLIIAMLLGWSVAQAATITIDEAAQAELQKPGCFGEGGLQCDLRIYQVMVEAFVDGDPDRDYTAGYGNSHHRGDLRGINQSLDYISGLGMNAIWLTPVFDSHAGEPQLRPDGSTAVDLRLDATGYFTRNYFAIDPRFGTLDDARALVRAAHERGMYVFFDGVFGHHKGDLVASPTGKLPIDSSDPADYGGDPSGYPGRVVDYSAPQTLEFYKEVAVYWIEELGIDGWRLDQAYQVPPAALREIKAAVKDVAEGRRLTGHRWGTLGYMVAEIFSGAEDIAEQAFGPEDHPILDSAFDFPMRWATMGVLAGEENGISRRPASTIAEDWAYGAHAGTYRPGALPNMMLGNHDFVRFGDLLQRVGLAQPADPQWWARHRLAFMVQAAYSGPITRYYGEELGDEVPGFSARVTVGCVELGFCDDHVARSSGKVPGISISEDELSADARILLDFHRQLMKTRKLYPALSHGSRQHLYSDGDLYVDLKSHGGQQVIFAMNSGAEAYDLKINVGLFQDVPAAAWDILASSSVPVREGYLTLTLDALSGKYILLAEQPISPVTINAGMNDAWYDPETAGQGILITVLPENGSVFLSWFTFDVERPDPETPHVLGEPGHRWLTAQGPIDDNRSRLRIYSTNGGIFNAGLPRPQTDQVGWMELEFDGCAATRLLYWIEDPPRQGEIRLNRIVNDNVGLCTVLASD